MEIFMNLLKRLKRSLSAGISLNLGAYAIYLRIGRRQIATNNSKEPVGSINLRQALFLQNKYPALKQMQLNLHESNAEQILKCFLEIIPAIDKQSREVCIRNALHRMRLKSEELQLKIDATREIARSDLRSGIPDRALTLSDDESVREELESQIAESDEAYGATLLGRGWPEASRGRSLCYYFEHHRDSIKGKSILHFSPEPELHAWMLANSPALSINYKTSNIAGDDVDINQDLTAMTVGTEYDVVICHRVLEHILDDQKAFGELFRIIKPGGYLQISVPQSMHQAETREWRVPDLTHHEHVRHYGRDFAQKLAAAGFDVDEDRWLLQQAAEQLQSNGSYPLRMYNARKPLNG